LNKGVAIATGANLSYGLNRWSIKSGSQFTVTCVVGKRNVKAVNDVCSRRVTDKGRSERLEPCALKAARTVLRGGGAGNSVSLPDQAVASNLHFRQGDDSNL